jgi:ankyrin repeat protein
MTIQQSRGATMSAELFEAIDQHDGERVLLLLRSGASPNDSTPDVPYWKPLEAAIEEMESGGSIDVVKALIEAGADVNAPGDHPKIISRLHPIHCAVFNDNLLVAKLLLENGADPNVPTADGNTALKAAVENGNVEMARLLYRHRQ